MKWTNTIALLCALATISCEEPFPQYEAPKDVLRGEFVFEAADTVNVVYDPLLAGYNFNDVMIIKVLVTNIHDDLLEGRAQVAGLVTIQSFASIPRSLLVPLTNGTLRQPPLFQGNLALPPGQAAEFSVLWLPLATDNKLVFQGLPYVADGNVRFYGPIDMIASVQVQLFELIQPMRFGNQQMRVVFRVTGEP